MSQDIKPKSEMKLGHYRLTVKLAEGIFSETWLSEHTYLEGKQICVKVFTNERFIKNLEKEKFLHVIKDPISLPNLEDYDPSNTPPYLAEELVGGRSLRQILRETKKCTALTAFDFLVKILKALKKIHEANAPHLDIRPEHILLNEQGNVKLLDYTLGRVTSATLAEYYKDFITKNIPLPKPVMRSLVYKSKLHRTGQEMNIQSDIFSLGVMLFEMVTGAYPGKNAESPCTLMPALPRKVDYIYNRCCSPKSDDFFENCDEILKALEQDEASPNLSPGIRPLKEDTAVVSVATFAGGKNYVDGKNIGVLSKNLDNILTTKLRFFAFDLTNIDYLNSSAIGFLVNFCDRIHGLGGAMVMFNVEKKVYTILEALGLEKVIKIMETPQKAEEYILNTTNNPPEEPKKEEKEPEG